MYVVTVEFTVHPASIADFLPLMTANAQRSREMEPSCRQFDVCLDPGRPEVVFLYELYDDRAAFDSHLATAHFREFDNAVKGMVGGKVVHAYLRGSP